MAFNPEKNSSSVSGSGRHGLVVTGFCRRIDTLQSKKGKDFRIIKVTCETDQFQLWDILDFSSSPFTVGQVVSIPVTPVVRTQNGQSSVSLIHSDRD